MIGRENTITREFRNALLITAALLSIPVLLVVGFAFGSGAKHLDMFYGAVFAQVGLVLVAGLTPWS